MKRLIGLLVIIGLLTSGCCGQTAPPATLPASFCYTLDNVESRDACLDAVDDGIEDDQRMRDYFTHTDTMISDGLEMQVYIERMQECVDDWDSAESTSERMTAYNCHYTQARVYANHLETTAVHLNEFETFLRTNKDYFDERGMNTQKHINGLQEARGAMKETLIYVEASLKSMETSLELEQQQQEDLEDLLGILVQLGLGLG